MSRQSNTGLSHGTSGSPQENLESLEYAAKVQEIENKLRKEFESPEQQNISVESVSNLEHTENFTEGGIKHIFEGEINHRGEAKGYHYEGIANTAGQVIPGTRTAPNAHGVYRGNVTVNGVTKRGFSSFFPQSWSPQQVVNSINQAYANREFVQGTRNTYKGTSSNGVSIYMYINRNGKIISAFPEE